MQFQDDFITLLTLINLIVLTPSINFKTKLTKMTTNTSRRDEYGFIRPDDFDYSLHEEFMSQYLRVLVRRGQKWEKILRKGYGKMDSGAKMKRYIRKGIPANHRAGVWMEVSGAAKLRREEPDLYQAMLTIPSTNQVALDQITTDLPRTFPNNIYFDTRDPASYQKPLYNVLLAFSNTNPTIGYCQGLNYIAGLILLVTKDEDSTFWLLKVLAEQILPDYYTPSMPGLLTDIKVLSELIKQEVPSVARHVEKLQLPWALVCSKWFICLFSEVLPTETVLRVWDCLFSEGSKILLRVAIAFVKMSQERLLAAGEFAQLVQEFKSIQTCKLTTNCHTFMESVFKEIGSFPQAKIVKLRKELGDQVRQEQIEREKRRMKDGSGLKDG